MLVRKKNCEVRFCIEYRRLNAVTERYGYSFSRIEDVLGRLSETKYFSSLDMESCLKNTKGKGVKKRHLLR